MTGPEGRGETAEPPQQSADSPASETKATLGEIENDPHQLEVEDEDVKIGELILGADFDPYHEDFKDEESAAFLLKASQLPTEDPIRHVQARLGESLHDDPGGKRSAMLWAP